MARRRALFPSLRGLMERKGWGTWAAPTAYWTPTSDAMRRAWPVERAVAEGYEKTVWVFKSVDAIASHQARLDFQLRDGDDVVDDHPLVHLLNDGRANPLETGREFRERLSAQVLLSPAGAFVEVTNSNRGTPIRLDLLPPGRTRPVPGKGADLLDRFETIAPDGRRVGIDPERVRWFRKVHPLDPFRGMTPLEAAGLSVDLDYLSRLYNVVFLRNDGRPATVVGVEGRLSQPEADRIEARFGRGPLEAGKVSVINGKISVQDLGANPRDMSYGEASARAKEEVLAAFGVGETVLGQASGRTYDNADAELFQFWTITMPPHLSIIASGFDQDSDDGLVGEFDVSGVEALRRVAAARRAEAREEAAAGLISLDEYRVRADYEEIDLPHTRALYVAQGKTPIPTKEEDAIALGLASPEPDPAAGGEQPGEQVPPEPGEDEPTAMGEEADSGETPPPNSGGQADAGAALARLQGLLDERQTKELPLAEPVPAAVPFIPRSALPTAVVEAVPDPIDQLETDLAQALTQLSRRLIERTVARAASPKLRKGTRHWEPEFEVDTRVGDAPLDVARIVDPAQWHEEAATALAPVADGGAAAAAEALAATVGATAAPPAVASEVVAWLAQGIAHSAAQLATWIRTTDAMGADMGAITGGIRATLPGHEKWAVGAATAAAGAITHAAETAAALELAGKTGLAVATWHAGDDQMERHTHRAVAGQSQPAGGAFPVGDHLLRWPRDLAASFEEAGGCRCRLRWLILPGL
ncbi:phage portal protein [Nonomuraea sp. NPDC051941]|uniref:phage portal protein n=1 Tax=Nonomuraea sp. NPDC051941 TaxID=3364373 RepID=UPI0037C56A60